METRLTLKPGQKGTKKLLKRYGDKLVCVRYRYDREKQKRYKTVELIVEEVEWTEKTALAEAKSKVALRVEWGETELGIKVKKAGGVWDAHKKVWELEYEQVERLGLQDRIVGWAEGLYI